MRIQMKELKKRIRNSLPAETPGQLRGLPKTLQKLNGQPRQNWHQETGISPIFWLKCGGSPMKPVSVKLPNSLLIIQLNRFIDD